MNEVLDQRTVEERKAFFQNTLDRLKTEFNEEDRFNFLNELKSVLSEWNEVKIKALICESEEIATRAKCLSEFRF